MTVTVESSEASRVWAVSSVPETFERQAAATPEATAVSFQGRHLSYAALNGRANQLARHLRRIGVRRGSAVGICAARSVEMVVALIAILKAGAGYVALDPTDPPERHTTVAADSGFAALLGHEQLISAFTGQLPTVRLDRDAADYDQLPDTNLSIELNGEDVAYVAYTSGSTGKPKGAVIPHRAVLRLALSPNYLTMGPRDAVLQLAPLAFDASTLELWMPLLNGGRVAVFPPEEPSLERITEVARTERVTVLWLTAGLFHQMAEGPIARLDTVRDLLAGGDVLSVSHVNRALAALPGVRMINGYGPTENTTFTCCHVVTTPVTTSTVPIGHPITGTRVRLLNHQLAPVGVGETGELYAAGEGVAHGYLGRPGLTSEKFLPDPYADRPGARMYRTGDLARLRADGAIEFLGRADDQIKVRGFRIEPGEVETTLRRHPDVQDAAVVVQSNPSTGSRLVAFVVSDRETPAAQLREHMSQTLPAYAVPSSFVRMDTLPLNRNGKVDRAQLRLLHDQQRSELSTVYRAPGDSIEEMLTKLWASLIGVERVGVDDNFFELGGHSLTAIRTVSEIVRVYDVRIEPRELYQRHTVAELAELVNERLLAAIEEMSDEEALALLRQHQASTEDAPDSTHGGQPETGDT